MTDNAQRADADYARNIAAAARMTRQWQWEEYVNGLLARGEQMAERARVTDRRNTYRGKKATR